MDRTLWLIECAHKGDKEAREAAVQENMGLVRNVAKRYQGRGTEREDLIQIGCIGLLKAIDYFDLSLGLRFSTYAVPMIAGEIKRFLRDDGLLKVSRSMKYTACQTCRIREELTHQLGREPTIGEISRKAGIPAEELIMAMEASAEVESLQNTLYQSDGNEISLEDRVEDKKDAVGELVNHIFLGSILEKLEPEEKQLIQFRYFDEMTQQQTGERMKKTQVQVSRMEKKILKKMRLCIKE